MDFRLSFFIMCTLFVDFAIAYLGIGAVQGVVLQHLLGVLGLAGTGLTGNEGRLMLALWKMTEI